MGHACGLLEGSRLRALALPVPTGRNPLGNIHTEDRKGLRGINRNSVRRVQWSCAAVTVVDIPEGRYSSNGSRTLASLSPFADIEVYTGDLRRIPRPGRGCRERQPWRGIERVPRPRWGWDHSRRDRRAPRVHRPTLAMP